MTRLISSRALLLTVAGACAVLVAAVQPASAQLVERSHDHFVDTITDDEACGIPVTTTIDVIENDLVRIGRSGFPLFQATGRGTITWTNPENGQSISDFFTGVFFKDLSATDNGDGTITLRTAVTGMPEALTLSDGTVVVRDRGRIVFRAIIDYNGTPTNVDDDIFISQETESISGPHPDLESDFALFCPTVIAALT